MPDVSRRSFAGLLGASITASQLPLVISGCSSASTATAPDPAQGWYIDGLSFLPADLNDIRASKIDAFICDISAIEQVKQADGTVNYRRIYRVCMESISVARARMAAHPVWLRLALAGADARLAKKDAQTALLSRFRARIVWSKVSHRWMNLTERDCEHFSLHIITGTFARVERGTATTVAALTCHSRQAVMN